MDNKISFKYHKINYGELMIGSIEDKLCICDWRYRKMRDAVDARLKKYFKADFVEEKSEVIEKTTIQLAEYFNYKRRVFELPLAFAGTDFQQKVWQVLVEVPFGKILSYQQLAENVGNKKAVRAVAGANGANAISIIVPCHRVIGSDGKLTGYAGGLAVKKKLLSLEQSFFV